MTGGKERLFSPIFVIVIICTLFGFLVGQGSNAGTTVYLERIGESTSLAGIGALVFSAACAIMRIISGPLSDVRGRRIVLIVGSIIMLCGTLGPLFGNEGGWFILWRFLQGSGFAATTTAAAAAASDVLPLSRLGEGLGYAGLGQAISMSIGPALAIFLISTDPPENFYVGLSACAAMAIICSILCRYEKHPLRLPKTAEYRVRYENGEVGTTHFSIRDGVWEPAALPGVIPMMIIAPAFGFGIFYMGVFGASIGVAGVGAFYTISAVSMIAVRLLSGRFMDKARPIAIMAGAVASGLVCYGLLLACSLGLFGEATAPIFYICGIFYGLCLGVALPINQSVAVSLSPPDHWGAANGLFLFGNDVSIGLASLVWGMLAEMFGFTITICVVIALIVASLPVAAMCYPRHEV